MQNHYSLIYREEEREMMPTLKAGTMTSSKCSLGLTLRCCRCSEWARSHGLLWLVDGSVVRSENRRSVERPIRESYDRQMFELNPNWPGVDVNIGSRKGCTTVRMPITKSSSGASDFSLWR